MESVSETYMTIRNKTTSETTDIPVDFIINTCGFKANPLNEALALAKDAKGYFRIRDTLQSISYDHVFAIGDCAVLDTGYGATADSADSVGGTAGTAVLPKNAQVAESQGAFVAANIARLIKARKRNKESKLQRYSYSSAGEILALGANNASIVTLCGCLCLWGRLAAISRRFTYAVKMPSWTLVFASIWKALVYAVCVIFCCR